MYEARAIFVDQYRHSMGHHGGSYLPENVFVLILGKVGLICPRFVPGLFLVYFWYMPKCVGRRFVHSLSQVCPYFVPFLSLVCHRLVSGLSLVSLWFVPGLSQFVPGLSHVCPWFVPNKWGKNKYILVLVNSNKLYKHCYLEVLLQVSG